MAIIATELTDTLDDFRENSNTVAALVGDGVDLVASFAKTNVVDALKDIDARFKNIAGTTQQIEDVKLVMSGGFGWNISVADTETPASITYTKPNTANAVKVKTDLTWDTSGNVTKIIYKWSSNTGGSWITVIAENIAYNSSGLVTGITWSAN